MERKASDKHRKYTTARLLRAAADAYFDSISVMETEKEACDTGEKDRIGRPVFEKRPLLSISGEPIRYRRYIRPPTVGGLCAFMGICRKTWYNYCDNEEYPQFADVTAFTHERMLTWNEEQLLTREGKDVRGIIFNLQANYGYAAKSEVEVGPRAAQAMQDVMSMAEKKALLDEIAALYIAQGAGGGDADGDES